MLIFKRYNGIIKKWGRYGVMREGKMKDIFVVGFAIFAMFFGAGNLIFPPYLGLKSGTSWFVGFLCFIIMDIGLSVLTLLVVTKLGKGARGVTEKLGRKPSLLILALNVICLGPLIAIPRTAATAFEFAVEPFYPSASTTVFSIVFFTAVVLFCLKQSKVIDIIGTVFAPLMLCALLVLIIKGIVTPIGTVELGISAGEAVKEGVNAGYQTMDVMAAMIFSATILSAVVQKGYKTQKQQFRMVSASGILAMLILFVVYGGLAYLGASVSGTYPHDVDRVVLLIAITKALLGRNGMVLLGGMVCVACLTPAIGLLSSSASFFEKQCEGRIKYRTFVIGFAVISCAISNLGISKILKLASPILNILYPLLILMVVLGIFKDYIKNDNVYKAAAFGTLIVSLLSLAEQFTGINFYLEALPFSQYGFQWVVPALVFGIVGGCVLPKEKRAGVFSMRKSKRKLPLFLFDFVIK